MDWSRAKTIFIITFLLLDIFLIQQLISQRNENTFDTIEEITIDERLEAQNIQVNDLPTEPTSAPYLEAEVKQIGINDLETDQQKIVNFGSGIKVEMDTPIPLKEDWEIEDVDEFIHSQALNGNQYKYWDYNEEKNEIIYYQVFNGQMLFNNESSQIVIQLNEKNEIESYTQNMLENIKEIQKQNIITAKQALSILLSKNLLQAESTVSNVELGYYSLVSSEPNQSQSQSQLLAPTWRITLNGEVEYFINAIEGHVFNEQRVIVE
jgi:regulatory protein YycI of two-component signal transduction system YycFG